MIILPAARLWTDLPDDMIEEDNDIVQFGGRLVAEALAQDLRALGYNTGPAEYEGDHGWAFTTRYRGRRIEAQFMTMGDGLTNMSTYDASLLRWTPWRKAQYVEWLCLLNDTMRKNPHFTRIQWHPEAFSADDDDEGSPEPVVDAV